jgi:hypothetical protein
MNIKKNSKLMSEDHPSNSIFILTIIAIVVLGAIFLYILNKPAGSETGDNLSPGICIAGTDCSPQITQNYSKENLTVSEKKMSTDLLQLIGIVKLPSGMNQDAFEHQMKQAQQLKWIDVNGKTTNDTISGRKVVHVYVKTLKNSDPNLVISYTWNVSDSDPSNAIIVAWVEPDNLPKLASLDAVQSIWTVLQPINN